ncbi:hypothetical protein NE237_030705 [Protea cynaroides]|uniref:Uncharacterized protein n=1 Tax=Protea cynaroides TaxID=273540 RepID=A0A9Q0GWG7_9MAGN|nr:hypothetical protein NE237_030705 [Protea cynaroides]
MGMDIANNTRNRANKGDSPTIKSQKTRRDESTPSCSPRLRFLEPKNKPDQSSHNPKSQPTPSQTASLSSSTSITFAHDQPQPKASRKPKAQASSEKREPAAAANASVNIFRSLSKF